MIECSDNNDCFNFNNISIPLHPEYLEGEKSKFVQLFVSIFGSREFQSKILGKSIIAALSALIILLSIAIWGFIFGSIGFVSSPEIWTS